MAGRDQAIRVVLIMLDNHLAGAVRRADGRLGREIPGLCLTHHAATEWDRDPKALESCRRDIARADIIVASMLFMEDHAQAVIPALQSRREKCDAMIGCMSAGDIIRLTRLGGLEMNEAPGGAIGLLKRLCGKKSKSRSAGAQQVAMVRRIPQFLRFIPGKAQDVRAYFLTLQYLIAGSDDNIVNLVRFLVGRYASSGSFGSLSVEPPVAYPDVGVYHPRLTSRFETSAKRLPQPKVVNGTVGLLVMRSYVLAGDSAHYDSVVDSLEARGLRVIPAFASGLDSRPAIERFFIEDGKPVVDAVVSLTGFSLVGGPAYNDAGAAEEMLARLNVPYLAAHAVEFQTIEQWQSPGGGLHPVETTMMVAIPELDGAVGPLLFGGRGEGAGDERQMRAVPERVEMLAARVARLIALRQTPRAKRRLAIVLFNFPPNGGSVGSAAYLSVYRSLFNTLQALRGAGYEVDLPQSVNDLRSRILDGNATRFGTPANVHCHLPVDDYVRRETWLDEIEAQWGPAPGRQQSDGRSIQVLGTQFGQVFVGIQPAFGYEGDPMRLLFESGFAPTHAFSAFYRYLREDFGAHALLHFGTHGALEFMPGKHTGLSGDCWPDRLIGDLPNFYLYAANNPSEATIAKRRSAATLVSYLTPPVVHAGLYSKLHDLKDSIDQWRALPPSNGEAERLADLIESQAAELDLSAADVGQFDTNTRITGLAESLAELEATLIPQGLHVVGDAMSRNDRLEVLTAMAAVAETPIEPAALSKLVDAVPMKDGRADKADTVSRLADVNRLLSQDHELGALVSALDGNYVRPAPGGDLLQAPEILPTGRNTHAFDPFRLPTTFAIQEGARQADLMLQRFADDGHDLPEAVAFVLWGTDNLKSGGCPISQVLALMGVGARFDTYGRLAGATLIPLSDLGRPRIDVVVTLSGIFRDLLPHQTRLLAEAAYLAAAADEPIERNFIRKHALAHQATHNCDLETAALRVFSNAEGTYGSNVNHLIDGGTWCAEEEIADTYAARKSFAYGRGGEPTQHKELLEDVLANVDFAYQNLESVELGVTTVDHYFDTLGGISRCLERAKGTTVPVYIGDHANGRSRVRTLTEQVALETRTRALNPKWYEGMLEHGYEGVRHIEAHVTNTVGWSATTGQVSPWVYQHLTQTFVLDEVMRERLAALNPAASSRVANRLIEAHERNYWSPDDDVLAALQDAGEQLEDRLEGVEIAA